MKTIKINTTKDMTIYTFNELSKDIQCEIKKNFISEFIRYGVYDEFVSDIIEYIIKNENIQLEFTPLDYCYNGEPSEMTIKNYKKIPLLIRFVFPNVEFDGENIQSKIFDHDGFNLSQYNLLASTEKKDVIKLYDELQQYFSYCSKLICDTFDNYMKNESLSLETRALYKHCCQYYYTASGEDIGLIEELEK
jgi:hypothetical protein